MREPAHRLRRLVAWSVIAVCAAAALWSLPDVLRPLRSDIEIGTSRPRAAREAQPALTVGLTNLALFEAAEKLIPPGSRYRIVTGPGTGVGDPQVLRWVRPYARYSLLPRRLVGVRGDPEWIVSFGGDLDLLGLRYERIVPVGRGLRIAKVERAG